jgi:hypothetical protein
MSQHYTSRQHLIKGQNGQMGKTKEKNKIIYIYILPKKAQGETPT